MHLPKETLIEQALAFHHPQGPTPLAPDQIAEKLQVPLSLLLQVQRRMEAIHRTQDGEDGRNRLTRGERLPDRLILPNPPEEHGSLLYKREGCRCDPCTDAASAESKLRRQLRRAGIQHPNSRPGRQIYPRHLPYEAYEPPGPVMQIDQEEAAS